jgi:hypothetical protein
MGGRSQLIASERSFAQDLPLWSCPTKRRLARRERIVASEIEETETAVIEKRKNKAKWLGC